MERIPLTEFKQRVQHIQKELAKRSLDGLITFGNEF